MFGFTDVRGAVSVAFTDRHGGVSRGAYSSLNLAASGGDDPAAVQQNLRLVAHEFSDGRPLASMHQVHGAEVAVVDGGGAGAVDQARSPEPPKVDGLLTRQQGQALMVRVADCVPVLLADPDHGVVAAAHAGRLGLVAGVVPTTIATMRSHGAQSITAWIGPHICGRCYEVPDRMREEVAGVVPESRSETSWGTPALDIGAGVRAQLRAAGADIVDAAARCTLEHADDLYSYRRDGSLSGRSAGLIRLVP